MTDESVPGLFLVELTGADGRPAGYAVASRAAYWTGDDAREHPEVQRLVSGYMERGPYLRAVGIPLTTAPDGVGFALFRSGHDVDP